MELIFDFLRFHKVIDVFQTSNYTNVAFLQNIKHIITGYYMDYMVYVFIWVILGLPPFLLFIIKFYILYFIIHSGLLLSGLVLLLLSNTLVILGIIRILTLATITIKYHNYDK